MCQYQYETIDVKRVSFVFVYTICIKTTDKRNA